MEQKDITKLKHGLEYLESIKEPTEESHAIALIGLFLGKIAHLWLARKSYTMTDGAQAMITLRDGHTYEITVRVLKGIILAVCLGTGLTGCATDGAAWGAFAQGMAGSQRQQQQAEQPVWRPAQSRQTNCVSTSDRYATYTNCQGQ